MAPSAQRISGAAAVRGLLDASLQYQRQVKKTVASIQIEQALGHLDGREQAYAAVLMALSSVERDIDWLGTTAQVLLGLRES